MDKLIYIADDDENIRNLVKMFLESDGYIVKTFVTGDDLFSKYKKEPCNLVILDIMMPGTDGLTICNQIRSISKVPIILLTAKDTDSDYISGITLGSDDYLTKPFRPTILNMRVKALLRRVEMGHYKGQVKDIKCGNLYLSEKNHSVLCQNKTIELTPTEYSVIKYLMQHFNEAISRESLLTEIWGYSQSVETRVTDETIRRIRKKLSITDSKIRIINIWGYGYKLTDMEDTKHE